MIGSGFSRNAEKLLPDGKDIPLLKENINSLFNELYSQKEYEKDSYENLKNKLTHNSNIAKLANEYEITLGTSKLQSLLISSINDNSFKPGKLHEMMLKLPWSDVFTTNYDTLLERASDLIYERNYEIVRNISDIPNKQKPRIVKLHGSFPSDKPFIITEEHYREYPKKFAPLVNLVQQSLMENIFSLIGFSGDDPNFLLGIGWVRDYLGDFVHPIHLIGILELSIPQRKFLEHKNIRIIDLNSVSIRKP